MDADPEGVHHSLLAQVQHYANCNLFPGQEARSTILHCMQSRLFSVAGSFPVSARPVRGPQQPSSAREQNVETADSGWKLVLLSLDFLTSLGMFKVAAGNDNLTTCTPAGWESSLAQMWCSGSAARLWLWTRDKKHCRLELSALNVLIFHVGISSLKKYISPGKNKKSILTTPPPHLCIR